MKLSRFFGLVTEAGVEHGPDAVPRKKKSPFGKKTGGLRMPPDADKNQVGNFDPDGSYMKKQAKPPAPPPESERPFAASSPKPSPALQGGKTGGTVKADPLTLDALERALESVRTGDADLEAWIEDTLSEIGRALRSGGDVALPKFVAAPDEEGDDGQEDEDY